MRNRIVAVLLALAMVAVCASCAGDRAGEASEPPVETMRQEEPPEQGDVPQAEEPPLYEEYVSSAFRERIAALGDEAWMGLTTEEMLEDWDYLYNSLVDNYPYFGVVRRTTGMDMHEAYRQVREEIPGMSDSDFFLAVYDYIKQTGNAGHFSLSSPWSDAPVPTAYETIAPLQQQVIDEYWAMVDEEPAEQNLTLAVLEEGRIAYVKIRSFGWGEMLEDDEPLMEFYRQVQDFDHLIFDITGNGGGSMSYYTDLIMAPLMRQAEFYPIYTFMKDGQLNRQHLAQRGGDMEDGLLLSQSPADSAAEFLSYAQADLDEDQYQRVKALFEALEWPPADMVPEDFAEFDRYNWNINGAGPGMAYEKEEEEHLPFEGKIWLLVDGDVYSASEAFAVAAKATGFATLVGTQTGGDGIGMDPVRFPLPNSRLYIRYAPIYGTTADGRSSEEFGTTPDIISPTGESPLETCLREIG